jgi:hypothetical protein
MQYKRKLRNIGGSLVFTIPPDLARYMGLKTEDIVIIQDDIGKKGKFISAWKGENDAGNTKTAK